MTKDPRLVIKKISSLIQARLRHHTACRCAQFRWGKSAIYVIRKQDSREYLYIMSIIPLFPIRSADCHSFMQTSGISYPHQRRENGSKNTHIAILIFN